MYRSSPQSRLEAYQYNPQAVQDHDDDQIQEKKGRSAGRRNKATYRPTPLTWPFISVLILLVAVAIGLVIFVRHTKPDSDDDAHIETRDLNRHAVQGVPRGGVAPRQLEEIGDGVLTITLSSGDDNENSATATSPDATPALISTQSTTPTTQPEITLSQPSATTDIPTSLASVGGVWQGNGTITSQVEYVQLMASTTVITSCGPEVCILEEMVVSYYKTEVSVVISIPIETKSSVELVPLLETMTLATNVHNVTVGTSSVQVTLSGDESTKTVLVTSSVAIGTTTISPTMESSKHYGNSSETTTGKVMNPPPVFPSRSTMFSEVVSTKTVETQQIPGTVIAVPTTLLSETTEYIVSTMTIEPAELGSDSDPITAVYINTGSTTLFETRTIPNPNRKVPVEVVSVTVVEIPNLIVTNEITINGNTIVTQGPDEVVTRYVVPDPATVVSKVEATVAVVVVVTTIPANTPITQVVVSRVGGQLATLVQERKLQTIVSTIGGFTQTVVTIPPVQTITSFVGGTAVSVPTGTSVDVAGETVTLYRVSIAGGYMSTFVTQPPPETIVQIADGLITNTVVTTPDAQTITSVVGGTAVSVPIGTSVDEAGEVVTLYVESTVGGSTNFLVTQPPPETIIQTVGGLVTTTAVTTPDAQTITSVVGGTTISVPTGTSVGEAGKTVTLYGESTVGGSTKLFVTQPPPETIVRTVGGFVTTIVTALEAETLTTMVGGTLTTMTVVSNPTGAIVSTYTTSSTIDGYLTTIINTLSGSSIVTTISGKLTTIVPSPSVTTMVSTINGTSYTSSITATGTSTPVPEDAIIVTAQTVSGFTEAEYFAGKFFPAFYAIGLTVFLKIIDTNAKLYQPFHALSSPSGAFGQDSLNLQYNGLMGFITPVITLVQGHPIPFITTFAVLLSSFLVPLSSEAIGIKLTGNCHITAIENCAGELGVSSAIAVILVVVLASIILLLLLLLFFLRKYNTGLHSNPWSIAGMSSLATNPDIRISGADGAAIKTCLAEKRFGLGSFENSHGHDDYGLILMDESGQQLRRDGSDSDDGSDYGAQEGGVETDAAVGDKKHTVPFMALSLAWRLAFMTVLLAMFGLTLYYHLTSTKSNPLRDWIQGQTFGVKFLFAGAGVIVAMCFFSFFTSIALISPYANMQHRSQPPDKSILLTRPTNAFFGIYTAIKRGDIFLIVVALMAIITEFLPILLVNVPYSLTQTRTTHIICTRMTMAVLMADVLVVFASLFRKWPHMPTDPRNIAGAMYYVVESRMMRDFEGTSEMKRNERDKWLREKGRRYFYGETTGDRGGARMSVEGDSVTGEGGLNKIKTEYRGYEGT